MKPVLRALFLVALCVLIVSSLWSPPAVSSAASPVANPKTKVDPGRKLRQQILRNVLLDHFCIGVDAPSDWQADVRKTSGATFDFTVNYLSGGIGHGDPWFFKYGNFLENQVLGCKSNNMGAWFTWYMLSQSMPADYKPGPKEAAPANAKVASTMFQYFDWFKRSLIEINKHPEVPVVMQIEPDEWCHLLLSKNFNPSAVEVKVGSCGMPDLVGLPDNEIGWAQAFAKLRDLYAPNMLLCCNPSGWDWQNSMDGTHMGTVFKQMCGDDYELANFEVSDRDKSAAGSNQLPPYGERCGILPTFSDHLKWIRDFHNTTGWWVCVWQVAMGNTYYDSCNNTPGHRCDNLAQFILEGYPKNTGIAQYVDAGCCGWMFNGGQPDSTNCYDAKKDGITNPSPIRGNAGHKAEFADDDGGFMRVFGGKYYQHPYPIMAKPKPAATPVHVEKAVRKATLADATAPTRYSDLLKKRIAQEIGANRSMSFHFSILNASVRIDSAHDGNFTVIMEDGGQMDLNWSSLKLSDLMQLAQLQIRQNHPEDRALYAFYLLMDDDISKAEDQLSQAANFDQDVCKAFTIK
jgi:hypothetical protein